MLIANPLYDHAFKYLMSNDRLAKKVLSVILDKEVLELALSQQELVVENEERRFTLYRLDFKAVIMDSRGRKETVLIELQKSKLPTNVLRFRNYLGMTYAQKKRQPENSDHALPIISIYILGYNVEDIPMVATKVDRKVIDITNHEEIELESDFIDLLTHSCYILQVRRLPVERRSRIEQFLSLFNQAWVQEEGYILDLKEVPEGFDDIAAYLQQPLQDEESRAKLRAEEEVENLFAYQEAEKEQLLQLLEEERRKKEEERQEKERAAAQADLAKALVEEERRQKEEERQQKEAALVKVRESVFKLARLLKAAGATNAEIAEETGLSEEEIASL